MSKLSYKTLLIIFFSLLIGIVILWKFVLPNHKVSAAWWNDGWNYRKAISISNTSGSNLTDFQMSISIGTSALIASGKMQSDCDDIRITDINGNLLPYWIEENNPGCNQITDTKIWIKANSIPTSGATIFIYYGNSSAPSAQNGDNTFLEFDDFNNPSTINNWILESNPTTTYSIAGGTMTAIASSGDYSSAVFGSNYTNITVNSRFKAVSQSHGGFIFRGQTTAADNAYQWVIRQSVNDNRVQKRSSGVNSYLLGGSTGIALPSTFTSNTWYPIEFRVYGTQVDTYFNNQQAVNGDFADTNYSSGKIGILSYDGSEYFDYIFVRKYASTEPTTTLQSEEAGGGPVAYWKFDEGTGTTTYDSTSSKFNGTINGATWQTEDMCISGKCLSFDGNDYIQANNINIPANGNATIEGWYYFDTTAKTKGANMNLNSSLFQHSANDYLYVSGTADLFSIGASIPTKKWVHIAMTYSGDTSTNKLYINGKSYSISQQPASHTNSAISVETIGNIFNGKIDDVKIYPYARTADQIKQDYNSRGSYSGSGVNMGSSNGGINLSDGLVGYWKMDEGIGTTTTDSSGNNHLGTLNSVSWTNGKYGIGGSFSNAFIDVGTSPQYEFTNNVTFSAWIKPSSINSWHGIVSKGTDSQYEFRITGRSGYLGKFELATVINGTSTFSNYESNTILQANVWQHIVATFDGNKIKYYLNGIPDGEYLISGSMVTNLSTNLRIGSRLSGTPFNGLIDEVRLYNRALSPSEVTQLYEYAPGPIAEYNFEENTGDTVYDRSGNNKNGTWNGTTGNQWQPGKFGSAGNFNGSNNYILATNNLGISGNAEFTMCAWMKWTGTSWPSDYPSFMGNNSTSSTNHGLSFTLYQGRPAIDFWVNRWRASNALSLNTWYYLCGTKTQGIISTTSKIYVNGQLVSGAVEGTDTTPDITNSPPVIGRLDGTRWFKGLVDQVKYYNYARTQKQIIEDMNGSRPAASNKSMIGYWKFDEGSGTTANNSGNAGSALNGTFGAGSSAPTWTNDGKFGKALSFDGINDYITAPFQNFITKNGTYTFSTWIYLKGSGQNTIFQNSLNDTDRNGLATTGGNNIQFGYYDGSWHGKSGSISLNNWTHVVGVNNSGTLKLYINSIEQSGNNSPYVYSTNNYLYLGKTSLVGQEYPFNGLIDEVKIYNYALTDEEVKQDYNQGSALQMGQTSQTIGGTTTNLEYCIPGDTSLCASPVAEWNFEENTGTTTKDSSGNGNTGTFGTGSSAPTWSLGAKNKGSGLKFDGVNDYVNLGTPTSLNSITYPLTISLWAKPTTLTQNGVILSLDVTDSNSDIAVGIYNTENKILIGRQTYQYGLTGISSYLTAGKWQHWEIVFTDTTHINFYLDGVQQTLSSVSNYWTPSQNNIGAKSNGSLYSFNGSIDGVKIYNYARTPAQVAYDYNKGGPIGWWKFDECQGSTAYDSSGFGNNGAISIGTSGSQNSLGTCQIGTSAAWTNGASGHTNSSLNFDGSDDCINVGNPSSLNISKAITISTWVNLSTSLGYYARIVGKTRETAYVLGIQSSGKALFTANIGGVTQVPASANTTVPIGIFTHLVVTYDGTNIKYYFNGKPDGTVVPSPTGDIGINSNNLYIGSESGGGTFFPGKIDDVRIYNYALTPEQVKTLYNGGAVSFN